MRNLRYVLVFCIAVISSAVSAQEQTELSELMRSRGEYYFTVSVNDPSEVGTINRICSVDKTDGKVVACYANQREYDEMIQAGYKPFLQMPPSMRETHAMWDGKSKAWNAYPTYDQYVLMMQGFPEETVLGRSCSCIELGTLSSGRKLLGVRINNGDTDGKPKFLYSSTMHGDEVTGMILMLRLIDELCTSTDDRIVNLVNNLDIFIFPNTNPDGTYYGGNNTVNGARRYNANNVDINRNFPDFVNGTHPDGNRYQKETQWMMNLAQQYLFTMSANFHGGSEVMNYPWDCTYDLHADDAWWQYVCTEYASKAHAVSSSYMTDENNGITNGAAWYTISGSRQDYMNYYAQCREVTIECSTAKTPSASQLPNFWNYNHNSMLAYMEQCLNGVHGFVYDATSGEPIKGVTVTVQDHDKNGSQVSTHEAGDFHRPIKGGTYTFLFQKDGYCPQIVEVTVADGERVELNNIQLTPGDCLMPNFTASSTTVSLGQSVSFTDASFGNVASYYWTFDGATPSTSTAQNPTNIRYNAVGDYDVTLTITDAEGNSQTLTKSDYIHVAETVNMHSGTMTTCNAIFYDSGGPDANYGDNQDYTLIFYPGSEDAKVCVDFQSFEIESNYDFLYIYDGTSTSATLIGKFTGANNPGTVTATNADGALTFRFTSDYSVNKIGWVATVTCSYPDLILADNGENSTAISSANGKVRNVQLSNRTLYKDGSWNTLCLPFNVTLEGSPLEGAIAKTLDNATITGTHIRLIFGNAETMLSAGTPYIIRWEKSADYDTANPNTRDIKNPSFMGVTIDSSDQNITVADGHVKFIGYYDAKNITSDDDDIYYMTSNNTLKHTGIDRTLKACRAYFQFSADTRARQFVLDFDGNTATGIGALQVNGDNCVWYMLDGRKLNGQPTRRGLYIMKGHKVVIK